MAQSDKNWSPGALIPGTDYRIVQLIGRGGFGEVYEVEHVHLTRRFAVKVLSRAHAGRGDLVERLVREARALARLHPHPNLVEVTDMRRASDGRAFLVMERLRGRTLSEALRGGRAMQVGHAADVMRQLLRALDAAHRVGLVHRDVKPSNIFLCDDAVVKLLDFGIVKVLTETGGSQTMPGSTVGTPGYMAPEYIEGAPPDARSDVYSAGVVLWEMLAGHSPFPPGQLGHELLARVLTLGVPALEDAGHAGLPAALRAVVRKASARKPDGRYASAGEFSAALEAALRDGDVPRPARVLAPPSSFSPHAPRASGEATAPARYDATTGQAPLTLPGGDADDTLHARPSNGGLGASLRSLFDDVGDDAVSLAPTSEPPAPNPDRVEYALAHLPTPHSGTLPPRRQRGASRRVVLELPSPAEGAASARAIAFAPTLTSLDAPSAAPPGPEGARAPSPATVERQARDMPTPTAVPNVLPPEGAASTAEQGGVSSTGEGQGGRPARGVRARRAGLVALACAAATFAAWFGARAGGEAGRSKNTVTDSELSVSVLPSAAPAPAGEAPPAPRASLASASSTPDGSKQDQGAAPPSPSADAGSAPSPAPEGPNDAPAAPVAALAVASSSASSAPASAPPGALSAPDNHAAQGVSVASAVPSAAPSPPSPVAAAPEGPAEVHVVPSGGGRGAQAAPRASQSAGRTPTKPKGDTTGNANAAAREAKPSKPSRRKLGPMNDL